LRRCRTTAVTYTSQQHLAQIPPRPQPAPALASRASRSVVYRWFVRTHAHYLDAIERSRIGSARAHRMRRSCDRVARQSDDLRQPCPRRHRRESDCVAAECAIEVPRNGIGQGDRHTDADRQRRTEGKLSGSCPPHPLRTVRLLAAGADGSGHDACQRSDRPRVGKLKLTQIGSSPVASLDGDTLTTHSATGQKRRVRCEQRSGRQ
jgi:hypothetical protein